MMESCLPKGELLTKLWLETSLQTEMGFRDYIRGRINKPLFPVHLNVPSVIFRQMEDDLENSAIE